MQYSRLPTLFFLSCFCYFCYFWSITCFILDINKPILLDSLQKVFSQAFFNAFIHIKAARNIHNCANITVLRSVKEHNIPT